MDTLVVASMQSITCTLYSVDATRSLHKHSCLNVDVKPLISNFEHKVGYKT